MKLGKTVEELRTGQPQPLSSYEFVQWNVHLRREQQREELASKTKG